MTNRSSIRLTYEDYCEIPDDGRRHQLVDGEHYVTPSPGTRHQDIVARLFAELWLHVREHKSGRLFVAPLDVLLAVGTVVQPDILYVSPARTSIVMDKHIAGAPDLVVEVLSEGSRRLDEKTKLRAYEAHGVAECWYVDIEMDQIRVYRRTGDHFLPPVQLAADRQDTLTSPRFPGLSIPLSSVFA
jgi:Uma2 family endonuclease